MKKTHLSISHFLWCNAMREGVYTYDHFITCRGKRTLEESSIVFVGMHWADIIKFLWQCKIMHMACTACPYPLPYVEHMLCSWAHFLRMFNITYICMTLIRTRISYVPVLYACDFIYGKWWTQVIGKGMPCSVDPILHWDTLCLITEILPTQQVQLFYAHSWQQLAPFTGFSDSLPSTCCWLNVVLPVKLPMWNSPMTKEWLWQCNYWLPFCHSQCHRCMVCPCMEWARSHPTSPAMPQCISQGTSEKVPLQ